MSVSKLVIRRPDDWHLHLRDNALMGAVAPVSSRLFGRAIVMPNIVPPATTVQAVGEYRRRICAAVPEEHGFTPLMTLYLTESTRPETIDEGVRSGFVKAVKLFPAGATTNSENGVRDIETVMPVLARMAELGMPLSVHGEVTDEDVDIFDREAVFIDTVLVPLRRRLPELRIVLEHVTTAIGIDYVRSSEENLAGTITPHHLALTRNSILVGGIHPHYYCLPVAKRATDRAAIREAAASGDASFFFGSDSAPHVDSRKENASGSAGIFNAPTALSCVAAVLEDEGGLDNLEAFVSLNGPAFYRLPPNTSRITLRKLDEPVVVPEQLQTGDGPVTAFDPGFPLYWHIGDEEISD